MWAIYTAEDFPKWDTENNCVIDYVQRLGVQVILKAHQWTQLEDFYRHVRYESWIDAAGEGRESIVTGKEVATRICGDLGSRGIGMCDWNATSDEDKGKIAKVCDEKNLKFRRSFVDRFEQQFRTKTQGGPGRWVPNPYEQECYDLLGMKPPDVVQRNNSDRPATAPVIIQQEVDPEVLAQLVTAEVARVTAPQKR